MSKPVSLPSANNCAEFVAEVCFALILAGDLVREVGARVIEGQGVERIEHRRLAGVAAPVGLDAEDGDDDLRRHAVLRFHLRQLLAMFGEKRAATIDALLGDEDRPVIAPRLGFGRSRHRRDGAIADLRARQDRIDVGRIEAVLARRFADECGTYFRAGRLGQRQRRHNLRRRSRSARRRLGNQRCGGGRGGGGLAGSRRRLGGTGRDCEASARMAQP